MPTKILLVTPVEGFGELIHQTLEADGDYQVARFSTGEDALNYIEVEDPALVILDVAVKDMDVVDLGTALRQRYDDLCLLIVKPSETPVNQALEQLRPNAYLPKPFYLPDLLEIVDSAIDCDPIQPAESSSDQDSLVEVRPIRPVESIAAKTPEPAVQVPTSSAPPWLQDVNRSAQYLARLTLASSAQASLITRSNTLWASAGGLSHIAVQQVSEHLIHNWENYGKGDLARFISLESNAEEHLLYATNLVNDFVLALVFDAATPFTQIRTQVGDLAHMLSSIPEEAVEKLKLSPMDSVHDVVEYQVPADLPPVDIDELDPIEEEDELDFDWIQNPGSPAEAENALLPNDWLPANLAEEVFSTPPLASMDGLDYLDEEAVESIEIPDDWRPDASSSPERRSFLAELIDDDPPAAENESTSQESATAELPPIAESAKENLVETRPSFSLKPHAAEVQPAQETRPVSTEETERVNQMGGISISPPVLEPVSPALYNLTYACVLIPRFPEHLLTGNLATQLGKWIPQTCVAFGWRLEHLAIRPTYLQWIVNVPPATSPNVIVRDIRNITSTRIFDSFASYGEENPSGDFWAPGYLIMSSSNPPAAYIVQNFIDQTRQRQGYPGI